MWIFNSQCVLVESVKHALSISNTQLRKSADAAVAIHRMLYNAHNPVVVTELEYVVCGMDTTADHATPSPQFAGKRGDGPTTWY
jgi:hypothetical protein